MKARLLIANARYGPDELKVLSKAFDDAWELCAPNVSERPEAIELARTRLANIILGLANNGVLDAEELVNAALALMSQKANPGS